MTVLITLTVAGANTGPFNLYSDVDGYTTPFESSVPKASLLAGYTSTLVPLGTNVIRILSQGECTNYIDIVIGTPPTTTTTSTACVRPVGLSNFTFAYATDDPYFDFRGSLTDACNSLYAIAYTGFTVEAVDLTVGQTVYFLIGTDCTLVSTGYYILDGGTTIIYIVDGIVDSYPTCPTTTTTTTIAPAYINWVTGGDGTGYASSGFACASTIGGPTLYTANPYTGGGSIFYTDSLLTTPFNGGSLWYKVYNVAGAYSLAVQIDNSGVQIGSASC